MPVIINRMTLESRWFDMTSEQAEIAYPLVDFVHLATLKNTAWKIGDPDQVPPWHRKLVGDTPAEMDAGEKAAADAARLPEVKENKNDLIDRRTTELRAEGFEYPAASGDFWSLSENMQTRIANNYNLALQGENPFPLVLNSIDDTTKVSIANIAQLEMVYIKLNNKVNALVDGGTIIKDLIRAASTVAEVEAIVDSR